MSNPETESLLQQLEEISRSTLGYFTIVEEHLEKLEEEHEEDYPMLNPGRTNYWKILPLGVREAAENIIKPLTLLAVEVGEAVRRSPLLSETDERDIGFATKGMRSAIRMKRYWYQEPEIAHDEGTVLGFIPSCQGDSDIISPSQAKDLFEKWFEKMYSICEFVGLNVSEGHVSIVGSGLSAPAGYRPNTAFIMMAMQRDKPELVDVADTVKRCFKRFRITAFRADDIQHEDVITKRILDEIRTAEFLFADLTLERPSVYYEVGYAHALGRRVMLYRRTSTPVHFDLAGYNCPEYDNLRQLEDLLTKRLIHATGQRPETEE